MANSSGTLLPAQHGVTRTRPLLEAFAVFLLVMGSLYVTTIAIYQHALDAQKQEIRQSLLRTAYIVLSEIDPQLHASFVDPEDEYSAPFIDLEQGLMKIRFSDPSIAFIYTVIQDGETIRFVLDPTPPPTAGEDDVRVGLFDPYDDAPDELRRAFATGSVVTSQEPYTDQWGSFVSAFVPLRDADGKVIGMVCVDIDATDYLQRLAPIKRATVRAMVTAFFVAFLAASGTWFLRNFSRVLSQREQSLQQALASLPGSADVSGATGLNPPS